MNEMKQTFTILWVDDKEQVINYNEKQVKSYFDENLKEFQINIIKVMDPNKIKEYLGKEEIDIIVTDYNLEDDFNGIDVIKLIKRKNLLTDVLFYTAGKFDFDKKEIYQKIKFYGFVQISEGTKDILDPLSKLIKKNLRRCEDIIFLRGIVISRTIDLELRMNEFFAKYFKIPKKTQEAFHNFILENRNNSLGGKILTIESITKKHEIEKEFKEMITQLKILATERNLLAHCKNIQGNKLLSMGNNEKFDKKRIWKILNKINRVSETMNKLEEQVKTIKA